MSLRYRTCREGDEAAASALVAQYAPPGTPPRLALWWWAHPTVVVCDGPRLVGCASFSISLPPTPSLAAVQPQAIGWGHGMVVDAAYQGRGIGRELFQFRAALMRTLGLRFFIGHATPANAAMHALFAEHGLTPTTTITETDGSELVLFMGTVP